jgi:hypothetical protein
MKIEAMMKKLKNSRQIEPICLMLKNTPQHWQGFQWLQNNQTLDKTIWTTKTPNQQRS